MQLKAVGESRAARAYISQQRAGSRALHEDPQAKHQAQQDLEGELSFQLATSDCPGLAGSTRHSERESALQMLFRVGAVSRLELEGADRIAQDEIELCIRIAVELWPPRTSVSLGMGKLISEAEFAQQLVG